MFGSELIKLIQRDKYSHVLLEYDDIVLDPMFSSNRYWTKNEFIKGYGGKKVFIKIDTPVKLDLTVWENNKEWGPLKASVFGTVFRFLLFFSRGRIRLAEDCVSVAINALKMSGITVPIYVITPKQLREWLKEEGYDVTAHFATN